MTSTVETTGEQDIEGAVVALREAYAAELAAAKIAADAGRESERLGAEWKSAAQRRRECEDALNRAVALSAGLTQRPPSWL